MSREKLFFKSVFAIALVPLLILIGIGLYLGWMAFPAIKEFGFKFFIVNEWNPVKEQYGVAAFVFGTVVSSFLALLIALPLSVGGSLFLTERAPKTLEGFLGFLMEMLAAIPSVVYGLWGMYVLVPLLRLYVQPFLSDHFGSFVLFSGPPYGIGMMSAGIILAIMVIPTITALTREVFKNCDTSLKEAALALGSTQWESIRIGVLRESRSGIFGAVVLGFGRAFGETMAVTMLIGNRNDISWSLFSPAQTMASVIANEYAEAGSDLHLAALSFVGLTLFLVSLIFQRIGRQWVRS